MPPLLPGFVTVTWTVPEVAIALAGMLAVSMLELVQVVVIAWFAKLTTAFELKLVPVTVIGKAAPPAVALLGASIAIAGVVPGVGGVVE